MVKLCSCVKLTTRKNSYPIYVKLQVIREVKAITQRAAAKCFCVDPKRGKSGLPMKIWWRTSVYEVINQLAVQWIRWCCEARDHMTRKLVMIEAKFFHNSRPYRDPRFMASAGCLRRFMTRNKERL